MGIWNWGIFRGLSNCKVFDWAGNKNMDLRNCSSPPNPPPSTYFHSDSFERERERESTLFPFIHSFIHSFNQLTQMDVSHLMKFNIIAKHIVALDDLWNFLPQALSNIVWSYASAGESHPRLFDIIAKHIVALDDLWNFLP